jgi:hypothetical protein
VPAEPAPAGFFTTEQWNANAGAAESASVATASMLTHNRFRTITSLVLIAAMITPSLMRFK